jgi:hypothetical protein
MRASFGSLLVVPWILFAQSSWNMDAVPVITAAAPHEDRESATLKDRGELFGPDAGGRAREALRLVHRRHRAPVLIETVRSLDGVWIADAARQRAGSVDPDRLYILVAGDERDVGVVGARRGPASHLSDREREMIRRAFLGPLQAGKPDEAIDRGVRMIASTFDTLSTDPWSGVPTALVSAAIILAALVCLFGPVLWERLRKPEDGGEDLTAGRPVAYPGGSLAALVRNPARLIPSGDPIGVATPSGAPTATSPMLVPALVRRLRP